MRHALKKFWSTLRICARVIMARTFGEFIYSAWKGEIAYVLYRWRGHEYFLQALPEDLTELPRGVVQ